MSGPLIFISHSKELPACEGFRVELTRALENAGFSTWTDNEQLRASDDWEQRINRALALCRASVVVLSPPAVRSGFVPYEINTLVHRRSQAPRFKLLTVYCDGLTPEDLQVSAAWRAVNLQRLQAVKPSVLDIVDELRPLLEVHRRDSPQARLENAITQALEPAGRSALSAAAERLSVTPEAMDLDLAQAVGQHLLEVSVDEQYQALRLIADVSVQVAIDVYKKVAPHGWVPSAAGDAVRAAAGRPRGQRGAGINASLPLTCGMYVSRAFHDWRACEVEGNVSDDDVEELVGRARLALLEWLQHPAEEPVPADADIDADVADAEDDLPFLILPLDAAFPAALAAVRERWPHVPILVRCAEETEAAFEARALPFTPILRPPIVPDEEAQNIHMYMNNMKALKRRGRLAP